MLCQWSGLPFRQARTKLWSQALKAASLECTMTRFDPDSHPDRFVFEAQARQIRAEEIDKFFHAIGLWMALREHALAQRLSQWGQSVLHHQPVRHS